MVLTHPAYGQLRPVTDSASVLLARNPGKMTLEGTNTWVLRAPGRSDCVVVDPGPRDGDHIRALTELGTIALILITHHHIDHTGGLRQLARFAGSQVRSWDPKFLAGTLWPLKDGEQIEAAGLRIRVLHTPGHTADSVSFVLDDAVLTGDTILGRGTTVLESRDDALADYLRSLDQLIDVGAGRTLLPAHGPDHPDAGVVATQYREHRQERLNQIRAALAELGPKAKPLQIVRRVYHDVDKRLWPAALSSVKAQLAYLRELG